MLTEKPTTEDFVNVVVIENLLDALDLACHGSSDKDLILSLQRAARDVAKMLPENIDLRVYRMPDDGSDTANSLYRLLPEPPQCAIGPVLLPRYDELMLKGEVMG